MNVFVQPTGRRIEPFGDAPGESLVMNRPLSAWQAEAFAAAGLSRVDALTPPCLVVPDTLFTTGAALRAFVERAAGCDAVFVLKDSVHGRVTTPVQPSVTRVDAGWRFDAVRWVSGREEAPVEVVFDPDEQIVKFSLPPQFTGGREPEVSFPRHPFMTLHHWVHILWANQVAGSIELRSTPKWRFVLTGLWAALRARSLNPWRVLGKANKIGRRCNIHPTAVVEGSTLGDGVNIGPFARVLFSRLGDGVTLMPGANVEASTLGDRAFVSQYTTLRFCVLYPEAVASQYLMQQCVLGRGAMTTGAAFSIDINFDGNIRVPLDGALHDTGTNFLGSAFGHGARMGTGHWLASGRMIPNGAFVIRDPAEVIQRVPADLPTDRPVYLSNGHLVPLGAARKAP